MKFEALFWIGRAGPPGGESLRELKTRDARKRYAVIPSPSTSLRTGPVEEPREPT